jgi:virulence factor Mce-like protein
VAMVTLETDTAGSQLQEASDVKVRGVIVGDVREVAADAEGATIQLAINPEYLDQIPADVSARLLPKTLFGERFVSLELPEQPSQERLADGDVIGQDRSENAIELQRVIDDTLPLLQAVQPQDLAYTLGAIADAVRGRGESLGDNLVSTGEYFEQINTVMPELQQDISLLADFADTYDGAAEDLLAVLDNLAVTNTTVVDQAEQLRRDVQRRDELVQRDGGLPRAERAQPDLAGRDVAARAGPLRRVLAGLPVPAGGARPVGPADRGDLRAGRGPGPEPEHPVHAAAAQPVPAR